MTGHIRRIRRIDGPTLADLPARPDAFLEWLGGPASIRVPGRDPSRTRVVTTLLHGNEPSGLMATLAWLREAPTPAVDVRLILANVRAAAPDGGFVHRTLPGHRDLNRCFHGPFDNEDGALAQAILREIRDAAPEAVIDIHNNSGHNPAYGVGVDAGSDALQLVELFGDRFVLSHLRLGALMEALTDVPSITVEVGRSGDPRADEVALAGMRRFLESDVILSPGARPAIRILERPMRVCLREGATLVVSDTPPSADHPAELTIRADLDRHNFERVEAGTRIGWVRGEGRPLELIDEEGVDRAPEYFDIRDGELVARNHLIPIMITTDPAAAASDCLFYVVRERAATGTG